MRTFPRLLSSGFVTDKVSSRHRRNTARRPATAKRSAGRRPKPCAVPMVTSTPVAVRWKSEIAGKWASTRWQLVKAYRSETARVSDTFASIVLSPLADVTFSKFRLATASHKREPSPTVQLNATRLNRSRFVALTVTFTPASVNFVCSTVGKSFFHHWLRQNV